MGLVVLLGCVSCWALEVVLGGSAGKCVFVCWPVVTFGLGLVDVVGMVVAAC